jgi:hypothetical protein
MTFFGFWSLFHQQLDPDLCGSGSETLPLGSKNIFLKDNKKFRRKHAFNKNKSVQVTGKK